MELLLNKTLDVNTQNNFGRSPLHLAAEGSSEEIMEQLLEHGADVNLRNNFTLTPLLLSIIYGKGKIYIHSTSSKQ